MVSIANRAILVDLDTHKWGARKSSKEANAAVAKMMGSNPKAGNYTKYLISKEHIDPLFAAFQKIGDDYRARTSPWLDNAADGGKSNGGARVLHMKGYQDFVKTMNQDKDEIEAILENLYAHYYEWKEEAKSDLNGMYKEVDYPTLWDLKTRFSVSWHFAPVPDVSDWRVDLGEEETRRIKEELQTSIESAVKESFAHTVKRIQNVVSAMATTLHNYGQSDDKRAGRFNESLVPNVRELADLLPNLNLLDDPDFDTVATLIKEKLCVHETAELRNDEAVRKSVAEEADAILAKMGEFFA